MKERPILFSAPMVRALLAGTKTQTRRIMKPQPHHVSGAVPFGDPPAWAMRGGGAAAGSAVMRCPYGMRGDRLWVRETFADDWCDEGHPVQYRADGGLDGDMVDAGVTWRPSIHMPRRASRITLEITGVRVERLQDISGIDAVREGAQVPAHMPQDGADLDFARRWYRTTWESINGPGSWDANPFVWVVDFRRIEP